MNLYIHMHFIRLSKSLSFCPGWLCHFKGLFLPVWCEIHRSKIPLVMSLKLTSRRVSDTMYLMLFPPQHPCRSIIFPYVWFKSRWNKSTSWLCHWLGCYMTSWKLASLAFKNYERSTCSKWSTVSIYTLQKTLKLWSCPVFSSYSRLSTWAQARQFDIIGCMAINFITDYCLILSKMFDVMMFYH